MTGHSKSWITHLLSWKEGYLLLGACIPQLWMYLIMQHVPTFQNLMSFYIGLAVSSFLAALVWSVRPQCTPSGWFSWLSLLFISGATLTVLPLGFGELPCDLLMALGGIGLGWCFLRWFQVYCQVGLKDAVGYLLISFSLVAAFSLLGVWAEQKTGSYLMSILIPLAIASTIMVEHAHRSFAEAEHTDSPRLPSKPFHRQIVPIICELLVYGLILGVLRSAGAEAQDLSIGVELNLLLRALFPLVLLAWINVQFKPRSFIDISQTSIIVMIVIFLALTLLGDMGAMVSSVLVSFTRNVVIILLSIVSLYMVHNSSWHPIAVYGMTRGLHTVFTQAGMIISMTIGLANVSVSISLNMIIFVIACISLFLANRSSKIVRMLSETSTEKTPASSQNANDRPPEDKASDALVDGYAQTDRRCDEISAEYSLTERERQIMKLICRGRSRGYIADALTISENTVRFHTKRLYSALGIHSKQELLTLVGLD